MPAGNPKIPNYRERAALQKIRSGKWAIARSLHPAGPTTIAHMVGKGWIEMSADDGVEMRKYRITQLGLKVFAAKISAPR